MYIQTLVPFLGGLPITQKMASRGDLVMPSCLNVHRELIFYRGEPIKRTRNTR